MQILIELVKTAHSCIIWFINKSIDSIKERKEQIEVRKCLLSFGAEYFVFELAI
jgi:hypothetical protein